VAFDKDAGGKGEGGGVQGNEVSKRDLDFWAKAGDLRDSKWN